MKNFLVPATVVAIICITDIFLISSDNKTERYISSTVGLRLRKAPDLNSETTALIPFMDKVVVIEEKNEEVYVSKRYGKWCLVSWGDKKGWIFGGYLSSFNVAGFKEKVADYYRMYFNDYYKKEHCKPSELLSMSAKDVEIVQVIEEYIVLRIPGDGYGGYGCGESAPRPVIWIYNENDKQFKKYFDFRDYEQNGHGSNICKFSLGYLANKKNLGIIIRACYDDGFNMWVSDINNIKIIREKEFNCIAIHEGEGDPVIDRCNNTTIKCLKDDFSTPVNYKYNCEKDIFEVSQ